MIEFILIFLLLLVVCLFLFVVRTQSKRIANLKSFTVERGVDEWIYVANATSVLFDELRYDGDALYLVGLGVLKVKVGIDASIMNDTVRHFESFGVPTQRV